MTKKPTRAQALTVIHRALSPLDRLHAVSRRAEHTDTCDAWQAIHTARRNLRRLARMVAT